MNTISEKYDIVIVGAGIIGATLACAIAQQERATKLTIALIEANDEINHYVGNDFDPRVVALTQASQNLFENIDIWRSIAYRRVCAYTDMEVWDGEGTANIHFTAADVRSVCLGYIVENSVVVNALREKLSQHKNITLLQPHKVSALDISQAASVVLDNGVVIEAKLLIAADGAQSKVRELANFETREWDYGHKAIITTVQTELPHQYTAWQRFMRTGPLAFLPLPDVDGKHFCSIVWSAEHELADELMLLSDVDFRTRLAGAFENKLGSIVHVAERFAIQLRQRHAKTYIQSNIVLVGDAAHNIHPLAGQGVNLGLQDVAALAGEIERALQRDIPLDDYSILRRYQRQRLAGNLTMMSVMEAFKRLFGSDSLFISWLRNSGMRQLNSLTELKKVIIKMAMGIN